MVTKQARKQFWEKYQCPGRFLKAPGLNRRRIKKQKHMSKSELQAMKTWWLRFKHNSVLREAQKKKDKKKGSKVKTEEQSEKNEKSAPKRKSSPAKEKTEKKKKGLKEKDEKETEEKKKDQKK